MRREPTRSEQLLWSALRNRQLAGRKFRRQHPVGRFVLDFYCPEARLAVEVDGPVHLGKRQADEERQRILEAQHIRLVRIPAALVEDDLPAALGMIQDALTAVPSAAARERGVRRSGRGEGVPAQRGGRL
jgi:very-short-patch-repair endonuclease